MYLIISLHKEINFHIGREMYESFALDKRYITTN